MCNKKLSYLIIVFIFLFISASISVIVYAQEPPPSQAPSAPTPGQQSSPEAFPGEPSGGTPPLSLPAGSAGTGPVAPAPQPQSVAPSAPSAGTDYALAEPLPVPGNAPITRINFIAYLQWLFPFMLSVAGILAVIMIIVGGLEYMTSAGSTDAISRAKDRITNAILGLLLAAASWLILYTINPDLIRFRLNITSLQALPEETYQGTTGQGTTGSRFSWGQPCNTRDVRPNNNCADSLVCIENPRRFGIIPAGGSGQCQNRP